MIPYGRQHVSQADIDAVVETLRSDWLTQGPRIEEFELAVCARTSAGYGVAVNSATSALHIACLSLGLGPGDILWTSPNTFVASANCGLYCGADVDFVDIDPNTYNMSIEALEQKLQAAKIGDRLPKIVVPVHFAGQSCDMKAIKELAGEYGFRIIEDASHAIGGSYRNEPVGSCRYSDIAVFSFHPVKIITTGEGGMALTSDADLADNMRRLRSHGITRDEALFEHATDGPWSYQQIDLGFNYRITDIQCALGRSQLDRIEDIIAERHRLAERYDALLEDLPVTAPYREDYAHSAFHLYVITLDEGDKLRRRDVFDAMRTAGIGVNIHYIPVHTQPWYQNLGFREGDFPRAEKYYRHCITLPLYPGLEAHEQQHVADTLKALLARM